MKYENEIACGRVSTDAMPAEDLTNMLKETRGMAREAGRLADKIGDHLFGGRKGDACCGEAKDAEPACFKDELAYLRSDLRRTVEDLAKICTLVGI